LIVRFFWLSLVAIHVAPLISLAGQVSQQGLTAAVSGKILGILLSMAFFAAKAAGARFLRVRCRWTGAVVFLLACSLAHQDLRQQVYADPTVTVSVAAVAVIAKATRRIASERLAGGRCESLAALLRAATWQRLVEPELLSPALVLKRASTVPRGPPAP
jgi:hypothetical protein